MFKYLWKRWLIHRQLRLLDKQTQRELTDFVLKLKGHGYVLRDGGNVVCDLCMSNCGQCGSSLHMAAMAKEYQVILECHATTRASFLRSV